MERVNICMSVSLFVTLIQGCNTRMSYKLVDNRGLYDIQVCHTYMYAALANASAAYRYVVHVYDSNVSLRHGHA
jgi:hypothetical protein